MKTNVYTLGVVFFCLGLHVACADDDTPEERQSADNKGTTLIQCGTNERVLKGACIPCPAGTTNEAGDLAGDENTTCDTIVCQENERVASNACVACPANTVNEAGDEATGSDSTCDPVSTDPCQENERVEGKLCVACPAGTVNEAGDDPKAADTSCDAILCQENEYVVANTCIPCAQGFMNEAGDDASDIDTVCDKSPCESNFRVQNGSCVQCAPGLTNEAGDDPSGEDTTCDSTLCQEDEHVVQNQCVACQEGLGRPAGDDPSGQDTLCALGTLTKRLTQGGDHGCLIADDGSIKCWGFNAFNQLGPADGVGASSSSPVDVPGLEQPAIQVEAAYLHTCALMMDKSVKCWGNNVRGQLGSGSGNQVSSSPEPVRLSSSQAPLTSVVQISAGQSHTCALTETGGVFCWGVNARGQLGIGSIANSPQAQLVVGLDQGVKEIKASGTHTCALMQNGSVKCWGENSSGQTTGNTLNALAPLDVMNLGGKAIGLGLGANQSCAIMEDRTAKCWGSTSNNLMGQSYAEDILRTPTKLPTVAGIQGLDGGESSICSLDTLGKVRCWGSNAQGQLGDGIQEANLNDFVDVSLPEEVVEVSVGNESVCVLGVSGKVFCWGFDEEGQLGSGKKLNPYRPVQVAGLESGIAQVSLGDKFGCAVTELNTVKCWGKNHFNQLGSNNRALSTTPLEIQRLVGRTITSVHAGRHHACAIDQGGVVRCWGRNSFGQLGNGNTSLTSSPVIPKDLGEPIVKIAAGAFHTCALGQSGNVKCWGSNGLGQLGTVSTNDSRVPVDVEGINDTVIDIAAGLAHTCAVTQSSGVFCWGRNPRGQLGNGTFTSSRTPVKVLLPITAIKSISGDSDHHCVTSTTGAVFCWGSNVAGQLATNNTANQPMPVELTASLGVPTQITGGGAWLSCFQQDLGVKCVGNAVRGILGNGARQATLSILDVVGLGALKSESLTVSGSNACVIEDNGGVQCWGAPDGGILGEGYIHSTGIPTEVQF